MKNLDWLKKLQASGARVPVLDEMPEILPHAQFYWQAYQTLSSRRLVVQGRPQPIQISEVLAYAQFIGVTDAYSRRDLLRLVVALDTEFLHFKPVAPPPARQGK